MSTVTSEIEADESAAPGAAGPVLDVVDRDLVGQLVAQARAGGMKLTGEGSLLAQLTRRVLESALEGEMTDHLGRGRGRPSWGANRADQRQHRLPLADARSDSRSERCLRQGPQAALRSSGPRRPPVSAA